MIVTRDLINSTDLVDRNQSPVPCISGQKFREINKLAAGVLMPEVDEHPIKVIGERRLLRQVGRHMHHEAQQKLEGLSGRVLRTRKKTPICPCCGSALLKQTRYWHSERLAKKYS